MAPSVTEDVRPAGAKGDHIDLQLTDTRVLVTGGSRGIGRATVEVLCAEGVRVATCARGRETLDEVVERLRGDGAM